MAGNNELTIPATRSSLAASALAELLKIFGALGIVNVLSLSLILRNNISLTDPRVPPQTNQLTDQAAEAIATAASVHSVELVGFSVSIVRPLDDWHWSAVGAGICLFLTFVRFCYGNIIVLEGEYIRGSESNDNGVSLNHALNAVILMPLFSIMSFYAGTGDLFSFGILILVLLLMDLIVFSLPAFNLFNIQNSPLIHSSRFTEEKKFWAILNTCTVSVIVIIMLADYVFHFFGNNGIGEPELYIFIAVYAIASVVDIIMLRGFYLGVKRGAQENYLWMRLVTKRSGE